MLVRMKKNKNVTQFQNHTHTHSHVSAIQHKKTHHVPHRSTLFVFNSVSSSGLTTKRVNNLKRMRCKMKQKNSHTTSLLSVESSIMNT